MLHCLLQWLKRAFRSSSTMIWVVCLSAWMNLLLLTCWTGPNTNRTGFIVTDSMPYNAALQACLAIGESLVDPRLFSSSTLSHLWKDTPPSFEQLFWVQSSTDLIRAINMNGKLVATKGSRSLPAICTQTAPPSNGTSADTNEKWQIGVKVANSTITGFGCCSFFSFLFLVPISILCLG